MRNPRTAHFHTLTYLSLGLEPKETVLVTFLIAETKYQQEAAKGGSVHSDLIQERVQSVMVGKLRQPECELAVWLHCNQETGPDYQTLKVLPS